MGNFFKGSMFGNDPFFKDMNMGFGGIDKMMKDAHKMMARASSMGPTPGGHGRFMKQTYQSSQTMGQDGRPHR